MARLDQASIKEAVRSSTHMMIIGQTKAGKTRYVVEAVKDGYHVVYVDTDNGLRTIQQELEGDQEALSRVHYFRPNNISTFLEKLFIQGEFEYDEVRGAVASRLESKPDNQVAVLRAMGMAQPGVILVIDSWTSLAFNITQLKAEKANNPIQSMDKMDRDLYSVVGNKLTFLANMIQHAPFHVIVQAHPGSYEILRKPENTVAKDIKEGDMIVDRVVEIPVSSSGKHGLNLGKHFTDIGWISIDRTSRRVLDFEPKYGRISGGAFSGKGDPMDKMRFSKLIGPAPKEVDVDAFVTYSTFEELHPAPTQSKQNTSGATTLGTPTKFVLPSTAK